MKIQIQNLFYALALLALLTSTVFAQGTTAFTYQGQLRDNGTNANGTYTMIFALYDSVTNGNQIGPAITNSPTLVNGLFTVNLDFGAGVFNGGARYLDIIVHNGSDSEELTPRVQVLPTPYSQFAAVAATVTNGAITTANIANGAIANANIGANAVTADNIAGGQVVKTLDGLNDAVSLVAGANVTLTTNGNNLTIASAISGSGSSIPNMQVFDTPGTFQFTVPANVTTIMVEVWGGGGGGGSADYANLQGGGGGGGGGYGKGVFPVIPGTVYNVIIGAGGSSDNRGTNSSFGSLINAIGGHSGNEDLPSGAIPQDGNLPGAKGGASVVGINITGGTGIFPIGAGGGDGGNAGCGGNGGRGDGGTGAEPGQIPGGGGGGGDYNGTGGIYGTGSLGASGGHGRVIVYY